LVLWLSQQQAHSVVMYTDCERRTHYSLAGEAKRALVTGARRIARRELIVVHGYCS